MSSSPPDLGPVLPSPAVLWTLGKEVAELGERIKLAAGKGPARDLQLAVHLVDSIRAVVGGTSGSDLPPRYAAPGFDPLRPEEVREAAATVAPNLERAAERLRTYCRFQNTPIGPGQYGPGVYFADIRAVVRELESYLLITPGDDGGGRP